MLTPYQFASNRPIDGIDLDGLEYLPYMKSMYRIQEVANSNTVAKTIYNNIPIALQDPKNQSFKYVSGGPVTAWGRDWDASIDGASVIQTGKYYNSGHKFYGKAEEGKSTNGIASLKGNATQATTITAQNINGVGGALGASGLGGMAANWLGNEEQNALIEERDLREGFYNATNAVDKINARKGFGGTALSSSERTSLINFMTDGYLPIQDFKRYGNELSKQGKLNVLGGFLNTANRGVQALGQLGKLQQETINQINDLLKRYKALGGDPNQFSGMNEYLNNNKKPK
jgi:hypothetical protein